MLRIWDNDHFAITVRKLYEDKYGESMNAARLARRLNQKRTNKDTQVSVEAVRKWITGETSPRTNHLFHLNELFDRELVGKVFNEKQ